LLLSISGNFYIYFKVALFYGYNDAKISALKESETA